jgi:hypothetical protein
MTREIICWPKYPDARKREFFIAFNYPLVSSNLSSYDTQLYSVSLSLKSVVEMVGNEYNFLELMRKINMQLKDSIMCNLNSTLTYPSWFWSLFIPEVEFGCIRSDVLGIVLYISSSATFYLRNIMFVNFLSSWMCLKYCSSDVKQQSINHFHNLCTVEIGSIELRF